MSRQTVPRPVPPDTDALVEEHRAAVLAALHLAGPALRKSALWGRRLAEILATGRRLLICGDVGSAGLAQQLSVEIVGRFGDRRPAFSALALQAHVGSPTAGDFDAVQAYARQVEAHAGPGDVLLLLSTSGRGPELVEAAACANRLAVVAWGLTGPAPNPLAQRCDDVASVPSVSTDAIQEVHLHAVHLLRAAFDAALPAAAERAP